MVVLRRAERVGDPSVTGGINSGSSADDLVRKKAGSGLDHGVPKIQEHSTHPESWALSRSVDTGGARVILYLSHTEMLWSILYSTQMCKQPTQFLRNNVTDSWWQCRGPQCFAPLNRSKSQGCQRLISKQIGLVRDARELDGRHL